MTCTELFTPMPLGMATARNGATMSMLNQHRIDLNEELVR
jgi:hypothetical protein